MGRRSYSFGLLHFRLVNDNISPFDVRYLGKGFQQEDIRVISRKMKLETAKPSLLSHLQHILSMSIEKKVVLDTIFEVLCNTVQASPKDRDLTRAIAGLRAQHVIQTRK